MMNGVTNIRTKVSSQGINDMLIAEYKKLNN